jgi:hypothetical protein
VNLLPYLKGEKSGTPHKVLFSRKLNCAAMRDGNWKLIRINNVIPALYNLASDIGEQNNVAIQYPERVQNMLNQMNNWEKGMTLPWWGEGQWESYTRKIHIELINKKGRAMKTVERMSLPGTRYIENKK